VLYKLGEQPPKCNVPYCKSGFQPTHGPVDARAQRGDRIGRLPAQHVERKGVHGADAVGQRLGIAQAVESTEAPSATEQQTYTVNPIPSN
jgi:hypothetical protein